MKDLDEKRKGAVTLPPSPGCPQPTFHCKANLSQVLCEAGQAEHTYTFSSSPTAPSFQPFPHLPPMQLSGQTAHPSGRTSGISFPKQLHLPGEPMNLRQLPPQERAPAPAPQSPPSLSLPLVTRPPVMAPAQPHLSFYFHSCSPMWSPLDFLYPIPSDLPSALL